MRVVAGDLDWKPVDDERCGFHHRTSSVSVQDIILGTPLLSVNATREEPELTMAGFAADDTIPS